MKEKKKGSGIQKRYLRYTIFLLVFALLLSSVGVWFYVRKNMAGAIIDKYEFMTERMGIALDNLFEQSDSVTAECILYEDVQKSLQTQGLEEVNHIALSKYFAYVGLDHVADYCYVDNKQNVYSRSYTKLTYQNVKDSGFEKFLGDDYAKTKWFWTEDRLFGTGEKALFIGRHVRSMDYAHEPGMLFFKMQDSFLKESLWTSREQKTGTAFGIVDGNGEVFMSNLPRDFSMDQKEKEKIEALLKKEGSGMLLSGEPVGGGALSAYRQEESGMILFSYVPEEILNQGLSRILIVLSGIYLFIIAAAVILSIYFSKRFTKPIQEINEAMNSFDGNDFTHTIELHTNTELDEIGNSYNKMLFNIEELLKERKAQEKELRTSELNMLISQINPHFLYNTLDTIYMLARINKEETTMKMIQALSKYLRLSLSKGHDIVTVEDELENVKSYMEIQQIRNQDLFSYEIDCQVDAANTWVLKLILQPLVENSIKYGFCNIFEGGRIRIKIYKEKEMLCLSVYNSGTPISKETVELVERMNEMPISVLKECFPDKTHGYGVMNIMTRLRLKYGEQVRFSYEAKEDGTNCMIRIPGGGQL